MRHAESARRKKRKLVETCNNRRGKSFIHPIIEWSEKEVWEYIHKYNVPYCTLYDEGFKRIGCICCPYARGESKQREIERWPAYKKLYIMAFDKMLKARKAAGLESIQNTGEEVFDWWIKGEAAKGKSNDNQSLFGLDGDVML